MSDTVAEPISPEVLNAFDLLRGDCALVQPKDLAIVELTGEDRKGWLQGQATNDLKQLDVGASSSFCLCQPTGQMVAVCDIWGLPNRFLLTCERSVVGGVMNRVRQMVVLEDVLARDVTDEYRLLSIQGPNASRALQEIVVLPTLDAADTRAGEREVVALRSNRTGLGGWDLLVPLSDNKTQAKVTKPFHLVPTESYEIARIEAGIPKAGVDWDQKTMPPELGPAFEARHVSYKKGCYTGQEVLMRIHSRGHTNRTWMALIADRGVQPGAAVSHPRRKDAGVITSACYSPDYGYLAAAMLRNEAALEGDLVQIEAQDGSVQAEVRQMPVLRFE